MNPNLVNILHKGDGPRDRFRITFTECVEDLKTLAELCRYYDCPVQEEKVNKMVKQLLKMDSVLLGEFGVR